MAYATEPDVLSLLGDLAISSSINVLGVIQDAANEIDSHLGELYVVPIVVASLPAHQAGMLKMMNARLAGGRLIMALAVGGEDRQLQAYGASLAQLAYDDLNRIVGGSVLLGGQAEVGPTRAVDIPGIVNYDEESAVYAFENTVLGGGTWWWAPGAV